MTPLPKTPDKNRKDSIETGEFTRLHVVSWNRIPTRNSTRGQGGPESDRRPVHLKVGLPSRRNLYLDTQSVPHSRGLADRHQLYPFRTKMTPCFSTGSTSSLSRPVLESQATGVSSEQLFNPTGQGVSGRQSTPSRNDCDLVL